MVFPMRIFFFFLLFMLLISMEALFFQLILGGKLSLVLRFFHFHSGYLL